LPHQQSNAVVKPADIYVESGLWIIKQTKIID